MHSSVGTYVPARRPSGALQAFLFALIVGIVAVLFGLIASTGNLIGVAVAVGLVLGIFLLLRLDLAIWLVLTGTLLINGLLGLAFHNLSKAAWLLSLLGFFLLGGAILTKLLSRERSQPLPDFINLLTVFMGVSIGISFFGEGGVLEVLVGTKRAFQLWGVALVIAMLPLTVLSQQRLRNWCMAAFAIALLQLPVALFERIVLVPKREGASGGVVAIDIISGTFEASLDGGGSTATMIIFLIVMLAYVLAAWRERILPTRWMCVFAVFFMAPLFLGETKLAVVLLPLTVLMVFGKAIRRSPAKAIGAITFGLVLTVVLGWVYVSMMRTGSVTMQQEADRMVAYNFGSVGYYDRYSVNRTTAISFWYRQHGMNDPVKMVFGHGIGSSYSGAGSLAPGHLSKRYPFMAINLTGLSTLLWDVGLLGTSMFLLALYLAWRRAGALLRQVQEAGVRAQIDALRMSLLCTVFSLMYSNSMFAGLSHEFLIAFTFGYLAWLVRQQAAKEAAQRSPAVSAR